MRQIVYHKWAQGYGTRPHGRERRGMRESYCFGADRIKQSNIVFSSILAASKSGHSGVICGLKLIVLD